MSKKKLTGREVLENNGRILLIDANTVAIEAPDGDQIHINLAKTSETVGLYLLLVSAGIDFVPYEGATNEKSNR